MTLPTQTRPPARWPWVIVVLLVLVADVILMGTSVGQCADYTAESGAESTCTSGPVLGLAGTWVLGAVSVLAIAYCGRRLVHRSR